MYKVRDPLNLNTLKSRLITRGFSQEHGVNYFETYAPTVDESILKTFLAIVAYRDLHCHHVDVNNAFTQAPLKERIYMKPPPGVILPRGRVWALKKSLYGLKQAARDWYNMCSTTLQDLGFRASPREPCLFHHATRDLHLLLYVDDCLVASRLLSDLVWFKASFGSRFKTKDLGPVRRILRLDIERDRHRRLLTVS